MNFESFFLFNIIFQHLEGKLFYNQRGVQHRGLQYWSYLFLIKLGGRYTVSVLLFFKFFMFKDS